MTERGWTVVIVRGIGVWLLASGVVTLASSIGGVASSSAAAESTGYNTGVTSIALSYGAWFGEAVAGIGIGLYLLLGAQWIIDWIANTAARGCRACGYPVSGSSEQCSECGVAEPLAKSQPDEPSRE